MVEVEDDEDWAGPEASAGGRGQPGSEGEKENKLCSLCHNDTIAKSTQIN